MYEAATLSEEESEIYFRIRSSLALFAHAKLDIDDAPSSPTNLCKRMYDSPWLQQALDEAWKHPEIIEEFARKHGSSGLGVRERAIARSWVHNLDAEFIAFMHEGRILLVRDGYIFDVLEITNQLDRSPNTYPRLVRTVLLPFERRIIFGGYVFASHDKPSATKRKAMEEQVRASLRDGEIVTTANRLIELAGPLSRRFAQEAAAIPSTELPQPPTEQLARESPARPSAEPHSPSDHPDPTHGFHKSEFSGMSPEERKRRRALRDGVDDKADLRQKYESHVLPHCAEGAPRHALADILDIDWPHNLETFAQCIRLDVSKGGNAGSLGLRIVEAFRKDHMLPEALLGVIGVEQVKRIRSFYEQGGCMALDLQDPIPLTQLPPFYFPLICYPFREGNKVTFVMPDEIRALFEEFDWERIERDIEARWQTIHFVEALASLHGIISMEEVIALLQEWYANLRVDKERDAFAEALFLHSHFNQLDCCMLIVPDGRFLLDFPLAEVTLFESDNDVRGMVCAPELPDYLAQLREAQKEFEPRPLEEGMCDSDSVYRWIKNLPAMRALHEYLDDHVPDGENDLEYADDIIQSLCLQAQPLGFDGLEVERLCDLIDDLGYKIYGGTRSKQFQTLLDNAANSVPLWACKGWAKMNIVWEVDGRRIIYNKDGSIARVGPNDACPCGSGIAYRECCGEGTQMWG